MGTHFFDIDGTIVNYHTNEWLEGAKETIIKLYSEGHQIIFITMRGEQDKDTIWSIENTKNTILKDLDDLGISYIILFGVQSPRTIHDDSKIYINQRITNQKFILDKISIGVIAESPEDFQNYIDSLVGDNYNKHKSRYHKFIDTDNFKYYCISNANHLCGLTIKDILVTENAYKNEELDNILYTLKPSLYTLPSEKAKEIKEKFEILINKHNNIKYYNL